MGVTAFGISPARAGQSRWVERDWRPCQCRPDRRHSNRLVSRLVSSLAHLHLADRVDFRAMDQGQTVDMGDLPQMWQMIDDLQKRADAATHHICESMAFTARALDEA